MANYLFAGAHRMQFVNSDRYAGRIKFTEGEFYMDVACITEKTDDIPFSYKLSNCFKLASAGDEAQLAAMITAWKANTLVLYRGFPGCHFCWPHLLNGELRSEGNDDHPTFTMGGTTRWLPTADLATAQGVSIQCTDIYTRELSMSEPIPIGFTVEVPVGKNRGAPICWLNAGEIVVRGPLQVGDYRMHSISWFDVQQVDFRAFPRALGDTFLPPQRPYLPTRHLHAWWQSCQPWMNSVALFDATLQLAAARRAQAAQIRQNRRNLMAAI